MPEIIGGRKVIFYIIAGIIIAVAFLFLAWIIPSNKSEIAIIPTGLENYLLIQRFFSSPYCFAFQDAGTRAYPWILDLEKFNQDNLDSCYDANSRDVKAYRLTLSYKKDASESMVPSQLGNPDTNGIYRYQASGATPIWYRHIGNGNWQWTPYEPPTDIWMPVTTTIVSGGSYNGKEPVEANINIINYLDENKPLPPAAPTDEKITIKTKNWQGFLEKAETFNVLVHDSEKTQKAQLFIEVQNAKI